MINNLFSLNFGKNRIPTSLAADLKIDREKGITTFRTYLYRIFHHTVIKTYFEMLKSSENEKL